MKSTLGRRAMMVALIVLGALAVIPGVHYYSYVKTHVSTDDAYVDGTAVLIASRVSGTVDQLNVQENWLVKKGDVLLTLDPRDFEVRVDQLRAQVERARETVDQLYSEVSAADAGQKLADSQLAQAQLDFKRAKELQDSGVVSREFFDRAQTSLAMAKANQTLAQREADRARAALGGETQDHARYHHAIVEQATSTLDAAKLDLGYTKIIAPVNGIITHKTVHTGNRVQAGQPLLSIVPIDSLYVTANFKETQLTDVRVGQKADIEADIYPGFTFHGHVDSIGFGTGAAFSLLPPENATGNWVKVVQRVPVKILLNDTPPEDKQLRMGLSVNVAIDISDTSGSLLSSQLQREFDKSRQYQRDHPMSN
ncbi:MAG TPA: HlyD family secretion protein [Candidatus Binataceae bacterium]|jgi:membrane fusion protein (multidrug efflux system)